MDKAFDTGRSYYDSTMKHIKELEDGKTIPGDSGSSLSPPEDFDIAKFHSGRQFFRNYAHSCIVAMFFSLVNGMSIPELLEALVFTQKSDTPRKALHRYLQTLRHVALWHYGNAWIKDSLAQQSVSDVRNMHQKVREQMQAKYEDRAELFLSQYDMGVVQSGFMGAVIMYPEDYGIKCNITELDDYVYFWYGIGHLLGIQKEYNICAHGFPQALSYVKEIEQEIVRKRLRDSHPDFVKMSTAVVKGAQFSEVFTLITRPVILALASELMIGSYEKLSFGDTIRFYTWKLIFLILKHSSLCRTFFRVRLEKTLGLVFVEA